jgi:hypothetical protein
MPQSAGRLWPPGLLRHPPMDTLQQVMCLFAKRLERGRFHLAVADRRRRDDLVGALVRHATIPTRTDARYADHGLSASCTNSARPSKPLRLSVWPAASQTRAPLGAGIIAAACPSPALSSAPIP